MKEYSLLTKDELMELKNEFLNEYEDLKAKGLKLNMATRR